MSAQRRRRDTGILNDPIDLDDTPRRPLPATYPEIAAVRGLVVEHRSSGVVGAILRLDRGAIVIEDRKGAPHRLALRPGAFDIEGRRSTLVAPKPPESRRQRLTASGSVAPERRRARVARASRIMVEGVHDAELVEKVWGDDLRVEGIVVETLGGMDDLEPIVADFAPGPERRLGILLDHLVEGAKEQRIASKIIHPDVLITGHPYVDVWAAIRPRTVGIESWPDVPMGSPWKEGVISALGVTEEPGRFWRRLLGQVESFRDLETPLVGAVEQLIDFVSSAGE